MALNKPDVIALLAEKQGDLPIRDVQEGVNYLLEQITRSVAAGERVEIRNFGAFTRQVLPARMGRNPKTGEAVALPPRYRVRFKPGKKLRGF